KRQSNQPIQHTYCSNPDIQTILFPQRCTVYRYTRKTVESIITRTFGLEATQKRTKPKQKNSNKNRTPMTPNTMQQQRLAPIAAVHIRS
ncbi:MAG TPA: hypothetical protein ACQGQF_05435, partial [Xylella fastidiosa subsp. pauca]